MAIIYFKDIWKSKPVYGSNCAAKNSGKYKYLTQSEIHNSKITKYTDDDSKMLIANDILISRAGAGAGAVYYHDTDENIAFAGYLVKYNLDQNICLNKYLYLYCKSNFKELMNLSSSGSTMPKLNPPDLKDWKLEIPDIKTQKSIIDIIESNKNLFLKYIKYIPLDNLQECKKKCELIIDIIEPISNLEFKIKLSIDLIEQIFKKSSQLYTDNEQKLINHVKFEKGKILKSSEFKKNGISAFLDVRSASKNRTISKYVDLESNTKFGDILLSLDGTPGRVTYTLEGFNGYLYNIKSEKISKSSILFNLIHEENQKIIKNNSFGTSILHASKAKEELKYYNSGNDFNEFYDFLININLISIKLEKIRDKIINLIF